MLDLNNIRKNILFALEDKPTGHLGGSLGTVEIQSLILESYINYNKNWYSDSQGLSETEKLAKATYSRNQRNKFILSNGHICPALYAVWAELGLFDELIESKYIGETEKNLSNNEKRMKFLRTIRNVDGVLEGHPSLYHLPFLVDSSTGPLGQGAGTSVGYAYSDLINQNGFYTFVSVGDGECQEGQIWESAMIAAKMKLYNLIWIIDRNFIQIDGDTEVVGGLDNSEIVSPDDNPISGLGEKFSSFGWVVTENWKGNDYDKCKDTLEETIKIARDKKLPAVILNYTQVGYPFEEFNSYKWHGKTPTHEQVRAAISKI